MNTRIKVCAVCLLLILCSGCAVGPNYKRPALPVPPDYRGSPGQAGNVGAVSFGDEKWWDAFHDAVLRELIQTALKQNYDVRIAAARILEARAQLGITRAGQVPSVDASVSAVNERIPQSGRFPTIETSTNQIGPAPRFLKRPRALVVAGNDGWR